MLRLHKPLKFRIPNKLAAFSALVLLITALVGGPQTQTGSEGLLHSVFSGAVPSDNPDRPLQASGSGQQPKKFRVSLMLFPAN